MSPTFSIITATYNSGDLLLRTAESLSRQTDGDFEWIVIDGASTDDSVRTLQTRSLLPFKLTSEPDKGIADAWNKGILQARGSYVLLLNAGDTYDQDFLERLKPHLSPELVTVSAARVLKENGQLQRIFTPEPAKLSHAMHLPHNWCAVPLEMYKKYGLYAHMKLAMDFEWFHRYFKVKGVAGFHVINEPLGAYHLGGVSDDNFIASFKANEQILVRNGTHPIVARLWRLTYTAKHAVRRMLS